MRDFDTVKQLIDYACKQYGSLSAYSPRRMTGEPVSVSFRELFDDVTALGTFLFSLGARGANVAVLGENCYETVLSFLTCVSGGTVVMLDRLLDKKELAEKVGFADCEYLICTAKYREYGEYISESCKLKRVICLDEIDEQLKAGRALLDGGNTDYIDCEPKKNDLAMISFTSGTTGASKGVMLSQYNIMSDALAACKYVSASGNTVLALPLNHMFAITVNIIVPLIYAMNVHICSSVRYLQKDIKNIGANTGVFVPMMTEIIYKEIFHAAKKKGETEKLNKAIKLSGICRKFGIDISRKLFHDIFDKLGESFKLIVCGGAPLNKQVVSDLCNMGITVLNGYGITECAPIVAVNKNKSNKIGSVGKALVCNEVKISPDGEILVRGSNVMQGYYKDPQATKAAFTKDGWFKTGDIGYIDREGFIFITGRMKNLIILSNGENISPEELELDLMKIPFVKEVVVFGDGDVITAEIYPEPGSDNPEQLISEKINELNREKPVYKRIHEIKFRDEPFQKTTTMKIKRDYAAASGK